MSRKKDIEALIKRADNDFIRIEKEYTTALEDKEISIDLQIDIKEMFGNLRSILDYIAHELVEKYCKTTNTKDHIYYPIRVDKESFDQVMNRTFQGLQEKCKTAYVTIKLSQPFMKPDNKWLAYFNEINNEQKHDRLVPQRLIEEKRVTAESKGKGSVSWNPSNVNFGRNVFIHGVQIDPETQLPIPSDTQTVKIEIWSDLQFEGINYSSIKLIKESLHEIKKIYNSLKEKL